MSLPCGFIKKHAFRIHLSSVSEARSLTLYIEMIREKPPMTIKKRNLSFAPDITAQHNQNSACAYTLHALYVIERWLTKKTEQRGRRVQVKHTCTGKREEVNGVGKKSNAQSYWPFRIPGETSDRV